MSNPVDLIEVWRGDLLESVHQGHAVVMDDTGQIVEAWGDPSAVIYPRSSCKMLQALPLIESGAADATRLRLPQLALACASHQGAAIHIDTVGAWMDQLGLEDTAFRCGPQMPRDQQDQEAMLRSGETPCRIHNNCSGKHAGFLTLARHLKADLDYCGIDHPVQWAVKDAFEDMVGEDSPTYGIDGCSAPNHACTVAGLARAMARFATAPERSDRRSVAATALVRAMTTHPDLVAGEGRACTDLMRATDGAVAVKTGAEGVFVAIAPTAKLGIALKIADGATRAAEAAITALMVRFGLLDPSHPVVDARMRTPIRNWDGLVTGAIRPSTGLM